MTRNQFAIAVLVVVPLLSSASAESQLRRTWRNTGNIVKVAKSGPGYRSIQAALDSITDASEDNPYLVSVAPGVYEEQVTMKPFVDIAGKGRGLTTIEWSPRTSALEERATVIGSENAVLRSLTVECVDENQHGSCWGICSPDAGEGVTIQARDVTVRASGSDYAMGVWASAGTTYLQDVAIEVSPQQIYGYCYSRGLFSWGGSAVLKDVSIQVTNDACENVGIHAKHRLEMTKSVVVVEGKPGHTCGIVKDGHGTAHLRNITVVGSPALCDEHWKMTVSHSEIDGLISIGYTGDFRLSHSQISGSIDKDPQGGSASCFSVHDADLNPLDENCQPIQ